MRYLHEKAGIVLRLVLLTVLLAAQSLSFAHELDHFSAGEASLCAVCSIGNNLDVPVQVTHEPPASSPNFQSVIQPSPEVSLKVIATPLSARAPPAS